MRIAATQYTLTKRTFEIYTSGCTLHCPGCHNPELWDFTIGEEVNPRSMDAVISKIHEHGELIDSIAILGGEPLDNNKVDFLYFISELLRHFPSKKFILFTGYDKVEIPYPIFMSFDEIKYGRYNEALKIEGEYLASSNQKIWKKGEPI
jgi:anaerobic ribonucleoside-triphosphate reductase activating protein